jgi:hypothetical protein
MALIIRSRTFTFTFGEADGVSVDPVGNVIVKETHEVENKQQQQIVAIISPADFLCMYYDDSVQVTEVGKKSESTPEPPPVAAEPTPQADATQS